MTAIGINNSGELTMTYGKEDIDYKTDGIASSGYLYNGADSAVWCRIRNLMATDLSNQYQTISPNCWSAEHIINEFDNSQGQFPEALWIENFKQVYEKTYLGQGLNGGKDAQPTPRFLKEMWNGRKKYQRRQWLRDQEDYFGTKHLTSNITSDQIMFRCNTPTGDDIVVTPNYTLNIIPYSDMYLSVKFGNSGVQQIRAKAGVSYQVLCPFSTMDDTAVLIYCASKIQALNDLSACYIHDNDFSKATKLQTLIVGSNIEGYDNKFLTSLMLGDNKLLQYLDIRNNSQLTGSINLSRLNLLETFYAEGTNVTGVTFANNGKIETAHLPASINTLIMRNLIYLTDLEIAGYDNLTSLTIQNCDIDSLSIVKETYDTLRTLNLTGISYDSQNQTGWYLTDTPTYNANIIGTDAPSTLLEQIYQITQKQNHTVSIEGKIYVPTIRQKYIDRYLSKWGNLQIDYRMFITQKAVTFLNADGNNIMLDGKSYVQYYDSGNPYLVKPYDPIAVGEIDTPTIPADEQYRYTFDHWEIYDSGVASGVPFDFTQSMSTDFTLIAVYNTEIRTYTVNWYKDDNKTTLLFTKEVPYGAEICFDECSEEEGFVPLQPLESSVEVNADGVEHAQYKMFKGWDKSTGYVRSDIDVCGCWVETPLLEKDKQTGRYNINKDNLNDMTMEEIYAISESGQWESFFKNHEQSQAEITMGHDFSFDNVEEQTIVEVGDSYILDGTNPFIAEDKDGTPIKLFGNTPQKNRNGSFTLVMDYQLKNDANGDSPKQDDMIISAFEKLGNGNEGFALRNNIASSIGYGNILWGNTNQRVSYALQRDLTVLRYNAGENKLYVYSFNGNPPTSQVNAASPSAVASPAQNVDYYFTGSADLGHYRYIRGKFVKIGDDPTASGRIRTAVTGGEYYSDVSVYTLNRNVANQLSDAVNGIPLILGGMAQFNSDTQEYTIANSNKGCAAIHWCKIWFDDLGDYNARQLAQWTRETYHPEYYHGFTDSSQINTGSPYKLSENNSKRANASFVFNEQLKYAHVMNISNVNAGGWNASLMRTFCNYRIFNGLPYEWQYLIKRVRVKAYSNSSTVVESHDKVYLAAAYEVNGSTASAEVNDGSKISWLQSSSSYPDCRMKWRGLKLDFSYGLTTSKQAKYTGMTNPVTTYGVYGSATKPDGTAKDPETGVKDGEVWKQTANGNYTGYMWMSLETYTKLGLTGGTRYYISTSDGEITLGYWMSAATFWLRSPYASGTNGFYYVGNTGYVGSNNANNANGVCPCFSI